MSMDRKEVNGAAVLVPVAGSTTPQILTVSSQGHFSHAPVINTDNHPGHETDPNGLDQHAPGAKCDSGKQLAGVLLDFSRALEAVADVGTFGANKYTRGGWQSVPEGEQRYTDALMRHLLKMQRENIDPDSGLEHLAHLAWNCLAVLELKRRAA